MESEQNLREQVEAAGRRSPGLLLAAVVVAGALAVATVVRLGAGAEGFAWAIAQVVLVFIAWFDALERRIPNLVVLCTAAAALALRIAFARHTLRESVLAAVLAFVVFFVLALIARGGLGMGDVKLAGLIGLLLGRDAVTALLLGGLIGGVAAIVLLARGASRSTSFAYGPYLAAGAAVVIVLQTPLPLTH
jgi:leader peptidase (prepilin peptidase)/N-methyltransferase